MPLKVDAEAVQALSLVTVSTEHGDKRRYYATASGPLLLVVCREGLVLSDLVGKTVDAALGWDRGYPGFVWRPGLQHSKVTIFAVTQAHAYYTLGDVLQIAPEG